MTLLLFTLVCGVACMLLRLVMMIYGCDDKGLLVSGHISLIAIWAITAVFLLGLLLGVRRLGSKGSYEQLFPASRLCGVIVVVSGAILLLGSIRSGSVPEMFAGIGAGFCVIYTGICRFSGIRPHFVFHFLICVFFIMKLIVHYQGWSADPQIQDYAFQMLACVLLMLAAFYRASADANIIYRERLVFTCLAACFMCVVSLSDLESPLYYGACGLWALGSMGWLEPVKEQTQD